MPITQLTNNLREAEEDFEASLSRLTELHTRFEVARKAAVRASSERSLALLHEKLDILGTVIVGNDDIRESLYYQVLLLRMWRAKIENRERLMVRAAQIFLIPIAIAGFMFVAGFVWNIVIRGGIQFNLPNP